MTVIRLGTLVSTNWLREQLASIQHNTNGILRILDTSWLPKPGIDSYTEFYQKSHIPGSKHFDLNQCVQPTPLIPRNLPDPKCFTDYVQGLGISSDTHIIAYDRFNTRPSVRTWWLFRLYGHNKISVLDGGLKKWVENGYEVTDEEPEVKRGNFETRLNPNLLRDYDAMVDNVQTKREQIVDARDVPSFMGETDLPPEIKSGHIPGARCIPFEDIFNPDGTFKSEKDLKKLFDQAGIDLGKPLVASCLAGLTACGLSTAAHILGKEVVPVYYGSWIEWGQRADADLCVTGK
ncbi:thiosulfate sulfurtransferase-like [Haliotis asinina]|uniref:thiosulfate sulfurtransferase-like n=1 Tax=Haliotis asinina TaxID=109174 RepID=UPI003531FCA4